MIDAKNEAVLLVRVALRRWYQFLILGAVVASVTYWLSVSKPRLWTSSLTITSEAAPQSLNAAIATELGIGAGTASQTPDFYAEYLRTDAALRQVVGRRYATAAGGADSTDLGTLMEVRSGDSALRVEKTIAAIRPLVVPSVIRRAGTMIVSVTLPDPVVAKQVADEIIVAINDLNTKVRQTIGRAERLFAEDRMRVAGEELREAEDSLKSFLEKNRLIEASPALLVERLRRERLMSRRQDVLGSLEVAYESARMEEVRNTPRISVIVEPRRPLLGNSRHTLGKMVFAAFAASAGLLLVGFLAERAAGGSVPRLLAQGWRDLRQISGKA